MKSPERFLMTYKNCSWMTASLDPRANAGGLGAAVLMTGRSGFWRRLIPLRLDNRMAKDFQPIKNAILIQLRSCALSDAHCRFYRLCHLHPRYEGLAVSVGDARSDFGCFVRNRRFPRKKDFLIKIIEILSHGFVD